MACIMHNDGRDLDLITHSDASCYCYVLYRLDRPLLIIIFAVRNVLVWKARLRKSSHQ